MTKETYQELIASLRLFARCLCRSDNEADELVAETLELAGRSTKKISKQLVLCHLLTVMRQRYYGSIGDEAAQLEPQKNVIYLYHKAPVYSGPIESDEIDLAIGMLPMHLREALVLFTALDLDADKVSTVVGCDVDAVLHRVHRARYMVQGYLQKLPDTLKAAATSNAGF